MADANAPKKKKKKRKRNGTMTTDCMYARGREMEENRALGVPIVLGRVCVAMVGRVRVRVTINLSANVLNELLQ